MSTTTKRKATTQLTPHSVDLETEVHTNAEFDPQSPFPRADDQELANRTFVVIKKGEPLPSDYFFDDSSDLVLDDNYAAPSNKKSHDSPKQESSVEEDSAPGDKEDVVMGDNQSTTNSSLAFQDQSKVSNTNLTDKTNNVDTQVNSSVQNVCSYSGTSEGVEQEFFWCSTCFPDDDSLGICEGCSANCHASHDTSNVKGRNTFTCGCGSGLAPKPCDILSEDSKEASSPKKPSFGGFGNASFTNTNTIAMKSAASFGIPKIDSNQDSNESNLNTAQEKKTFSFGNSKPFGSGETKSIGGATFGKPGDTKTLNSGLFGEGKQAGASILNLSGSFGSGDKLTSGLGSGFLAPAGSSEKDTPLPATNFTDKPFLSNDKPKAVFGKPSGDSKQVFGSSDDIKPAFGISSGDAKQTIVSPLGTKPAFGSSPNSTTPKLFTNSGSTSTLGGFASLGTKTETPGAFPFAKIGSVTTPDKPSFGFGSSPSQFRSFGEVKATDEEKPFISNNSNADNITSTVVGFEEASPILEKPTDLRTGEEQEITLFEEASKLYRFSDNQWKLLCQGKMKINKWTDENKYRLILRMEGGLKLMLNAPIFKGMNPQLADGNRVTFMTNNLCTPEFPISSFLVRFQTKELTEKFHSELTKSIDTL